VAPSAAAASAAAAPASWDDMVAAAKKEGTVVVAGPPDADTRAKLPEVIKQRFGVEVQYLSQNSSQVAARMQAERAAGQYTLDLMLSGADTAYTSMVANGWAEPLRASLVMPGVADPSKWKTGGPWFRDASKDTVLQLFNTVTTTLTVNAQMVTDKITTADALLDPKWKGKIASFDPSVNGIGIQVGAALYSSKGEDFLRKLYVGQNVVLTQDYRQVADWVAHGSYPLGIALAPQYLDEYQKLGITFATPELTDSHSQVSGGFGLVILVNRAPHPNAARVVANFLANTEGMTLFSQTQQQVPMRTDIDPTWIPKALIPQSGVDYFDGYDPEFLKGRRPAVLDFFKKLLK
jgi:iron(III) transport system substrate-binding protein